MNKFRELRADEIDCRIAQIKESGLSLLLYKDARCDQNILDETVGPMNWERFHSRENANCTVRIWDDDKKMWISKEDTGTESNTEKEKGLASDSFKRACFNWGIGRELYTAPFIWVQKKDCNIEGDKNRYKCFDRFTVKDIGYTNGCISKLKIKNSKTNKIVFDWTDKEEKPEQPDNEPEPAPEKKEPNATVTMGDRVPPLSEEMQYLNDALMAYSEKKKIPFADAKAKFKDLQIRTVNDGISPNKAITEYTKAEIQLILDLMKDGKAA